MLYFCDFSGGGGGVRTPSPSSGSAHVERDISPQSSLLAKIRTGPEVLNFEFIRKLKIKSNDWLLADTRPQTANHWALF